MFKRKQQFHIYLSFEISLFLNSNDASNDSSKCGLLFYSKPDILNMEISAEYFPICREKQIRK